jgi:glucose/arabinose dehydrogenase
MTAAFGRTVCCTVAALTAMVGCTHQTDAVVAPTVATTISTAPSADLSGSTPVASTAPVATVSATTAAAKPPTTRLTQLGSFQQPVGTSWRPSDGTIYVVEQNGTVAIMAKGQRATVALDMTDLTKADGERGLLGLAINADGSLAYVDYTNTDGNTRVDEYAIRADGTFDKSTRRNVLGFDQPYANHNGGSVQFGPDQMLYIGTGDGGASDDPERRALDRSSLLGKMLRIDPRPTAGAAYSIPPGNPFIGVDSAKAEIWSIGLRNPWRFSFDRTTGDMWIADVGQNQYEEIDVGWAADGRSAGANFGWSAFEGNHRHNEDQPADGVTAPIHEYGRDAGSSVSGGVRYRGSALPALVGWYVYGDYGNGQIRALQIDGKKVVKELTLGTVTHVAAVTEGPDGELYAVSNDGPVYALTQG